MAGWATVTFSENCSIVDRLRSNVSVSGMMGSGMTHQCRRQKLFRVCALDGYNEMNGPTCWTLGVESLIVCETC